MSEIKGTIDEKVAMGAIAGGAGSLTGSTGTAIVTKLIGTKCAGFAATKIAAGATIGLGPIAAGVAIVGGIAWLTYKSCK